MKVHPNTDGPFFMSFYELGYFGLFLGCLLSATIIPFASEGILLAFVLGGYDPLPSLFVATAGNSLGSISNYGLGLIGKPDRIKKRFRKPERYERFTLSIKKYGYWMSLLTWVPVVGDPLTILLGFFRVNFLYFLILMTLSKFLRYLIIIYFIW